MLYNTGKERLHNHCDVMKDYSTEENLTGDDVVGSGENLFKDQKSGHKYQNEDLGDTTSGHYNRLLNSHKVVIQNIGYNPSQNLVSGLSLTTANNGKNSLSRKHSAQTRTYRNECSPNVKSFLQKKRIATDKSSYRVNLTTNNIESTTGSHGTFLFFS